MSSINSVGSNSYALTQVIRSPSTPGVAAATPPGRDNDGDSDDSAAPAAASASAARQPAVNSSGQVIGGIFNATA